jgi:tetratricopeptide (TPR) repeat protein
MYVGWKAGGEWVYARLETLGLGGLYLNTLRPLPKDSSIDIVIVGLPTGRLYTRAVVRRSTPGLGMGLAFVTLPPDQRAHLYRFLTDHKATDEAPPSLPTADSPQVPADQEFSSEASFEIEFKKLIDMAGKGTYYQLLSVTPDSPIKLIRKNYYALARKIHPDHHMDKQELIPRLKDLMVTVTEAYNTLKDEEKRAGYDKLLANHGAFGFDSKGTNAHKSIEECFNRAKECLRAKNFAGSIVWLRKCVESAPDDAKYRVLLASSLATVPAYRTEALDNFEKAIDLDPWNIPALFRFAKLCEEMHLPWRAAPLYQRILEIDPEHKKAQEQLDSIGALKQKAKSPSATSRTIFGR